MKQPNPGGPHSYGISRKGEQGTREPVSGARALGGGGAGGTEPERVGMPAPGTDAHLIGRHVGGESLRGRKPARAALPTGRGAEGRDPELRLRPGRAWTAV